MKETIYIFDGSQIDRAKLLELLEGFDDDKPLTAGDLKYLIGQSPKQISPPKVKKNPSRHFPN